jgi:hypothetical protein
MPSPVFKDKAEGLRMMKEAGVSVETQEWMLNHLSDRPLATDISIALAFPIVVAGTSIAAPLLAGVEGVSAGTATITVTRWGRPGLQPGDWVMPGENTSWNYILSFKWQPNWFPGGNTSVARAAGETFRVLSSSVVAPYSEGRISNVIKWMFGQRQWRP